MIEKKTTEQIIENALKVGAIVIQPTGDYFYCPKKKDEVWVSLEEYNALSVEFASYKASLKKELDCYLEVAKRNNDKYFKNVKVADNKDRYMYWNATLKTLEYLYNSLCCGSLK
jgi:hypothetical protein